MLVRVAARRPNGDCTERRYPPPPRAVQSGRACRADPPATRQMRVSQKASQSVLRPGLCSYARVLWHLAQEACVATPTQSWAVCMATRIHKPSADAEAPMAEPRRATCPAQASVCVCARRFSDGLCAQHMQSRRRGLCRPGFPSVIELIAFFFNYRLLPVQAAIASRGGAEQNASCAHFMR